MTDRDAPTVWDSEWVDRVIAWFGRAAQTDNGVLVATGGELHKGNVYASLSNAIAELSAHYGETTTTIAAYALRVPTDGTDWSRPTDEDPRTGHRRRVAVFVPLTDGIGGDVQIRSRTTGQTFTPLPAMGETTGSRASNEYRFTPLEVGDAARLWVIAYGVDLSRRTTDLPH